MLVLLRLAQFVGKLLLLSVAVMLLAACDTGGSAQTPTTTVAKPGFHATLKTTDGQFVIQFSVTPNRLGLNTFTVDVQNASSAKPVPGLQVQLTTTMLDMNMGTEEMSLSPDGQGHYSAQGTLSMGGHWEIGILLRAPGSSLHKASVELATAT
jgi:copper transport protein